MAQKEYNQVTTKCANCSTEFNFGSTTDKLNVEICSHCHPFYTGKASLVDTSGRVEKFQARMSQAAANDTAKKEKKVRERKTRASISELNK